MASLKTVEILKTYNLRPTEGRKEVLDVIRHSKCALSHPEIEERLPIKLDRITTYRTLQSFKKKGIIHSIVDPQSGTARYLFSDGNLSHEHAHFKCMTCGSVECLKGQIGNLDLLRVPNDYRVVQFSFVIEGVCPKCHD